VCLEITLINSRFKIRIKRYKVAFRLFVTTVKFIVMTPVSTALTYQLRNIKESEVVPFQAMTQNRG